jgi:hypothetical protein
LVAGACLFPQMPGDDQPVDLSARTPDGKTPSAFQLVALRLADGSVFIGYTDLNGQIPIHWAPPGARLLEDPAVTPLEP